MFALTDQDHEDISKAFAYIPAQDSQKSRYNQLRQSARDMAVAIYECCPPGRPRSVAMTNLETTIMWANKAISQE